jgi:hypothetical protein
MSTEREFTYEEYREEYQKKHRENLCLKDRIRELEKQNEIIRADRINTTERLESEVAALKAEIERLKTELAKLVGCKTCWRDLQLIKLMTENYKMLDEMNDELRDQRDEEVEKNIAFEQQLSYKDAEIAEQTKRIEQLEIDDCAECRHQNIFKKREEPAELMKAREKYEYACTGMARDYGARDEYIQQLEAHYCPEKK